MAKKKSADHLARLYRESYRRETYLLRAELRCIRDDIRNLLAHVFVEHPIAIMLEPDAARVEHMADQLMEQDRQNAKDEKKRRKRPVHNHIGVLVTIAGPPAGEDPGPILQFESAGLYCITTGDRSVYNVDQSVLPPGWKMRLQGHPVGPSSGIWANLAHHKEVTGASEKS